MPHGDVRVWRWRNIAGHLNLVLETLIFKIFRKKIIHVVAQTLPLTVSERSYFHEFLKYSSKITPGYPRSVTRRNRHPHYQMNTERYLREPFGEVSSFPGSSKRSRYDSLGQCFSTFFGPVPLCNFQKFPRTPFDLKFSRQNLQR